MAEDIDGVLNASVEWNRFAGKTILISGAAGFLPSFMTEVLLSLNSRLGLDCKIIGLVRNPEKAQKRFTHHSGRRDLQLVTADVSKEVPVDAKCDFIIHAASQASPKYYGSDPVGTMEANLLGTQKMLTLARQSQSEAFMFVSSGEVYGQVSPEKVPTCELDYGYLDINNVRSCYAESKRAAETLCVSYLKQFGVPTKIVRPFHTYGPGIALDDGRVFADFVSDVVHKRDLVLHSDGKAVRAFCYISDAISGIFTVMLKGSHGIPYNVGNPQGAVSIGELADLIVGLFPELGLKVQRKGAAGTGYLPSPISVNVPNVDRLTELGWNASISPREGFYRTICHFMTRGAYA